MRFSEYIKDKILICLLHLLCMILLMGFFYITGYNRNAAALILIFLVDHPWDMDCDRILSQEEIF